MPYPHPASGSDVIFVPRTQEGNWGFRRHDFVGDICIWSSTVVLLWSSGGVHANEESSFFFAIGIGISRFLLTVGVELRFEDWGEEFSTRDDIELRFLFFVENALEKRDITFWYKALCFVLFLHVKAFAASFLYPTPQHVTFSQT